ncbi:Arm DNA-binding domain-containing protein [Tenacibaculum sp. Bg11-29]|uniref:Arm DNA-binding domain-containing protein n=1 Tax=Tenacibaculum sp. Bg11-29 TaxID=2058306 RepID=UPI0012FF0F3F
MTLIEVENAPGNYPVKSTGKFSVKKDYNCIDGTCAFYIQIFHNGKRKRIPLGINVKLSSFDEKRN